MTPRKNPVLSLGAVSGALVLFLAASLALAATENARDPAGVRERTRPASSPSAPSATTWMVASYNGIPGVGSLRAGSESNPPMWILFIPRADLDSTLHLQNPVGSGEALFVVDFYDTGGTLVNVESGSIPIHGSLSIELGSLTGLPPGYEGGAILESDQPIQAVVNIEPAGTGLLLSYGAVNVADVTIMLPALLRDFHEFNSSMWMQNAGSTTSKVTITYHGYGGGPVYSVVDSIPPYATHIRHLADETSLGANFQGWASVESDGPVAVTAETSSPQRGTAWCGIPVAHGDSTLLAPRQQKSGTQLISSSVIANVGVDLGLVTAEWHAGDGSLVYSQPGSVPPGEVAQYALPAIPGIPDSFDGSLVVGSDQLLGGIVNWQDLSRPGDPFAASPTLGLSQVSDSAYLPRVVHRASPQAYTEFSIQNATVVDASAQVTITLHDQSGAESAVVSGVIPYHGVGRYGTGDVPALGDEWEGSATVQATQPIAVEVVQFVSREVSTCPLVTDSGDSGPNTLRDCLERAGPGDTITFDPAIFPPGNPVSITLASALPAIVTDSLTIDASSAGVILEGSNVVGGHGDGLYVTSDGNLIKGLQILNFPGDGIEISGGADNTIAGCVIGGNQSAGINLSGTATLSNTITGNYIGTDASGTGAMPNGGYGILIAHAGRNVVGGPTEAERNIITYNLLGGVRLSDYESRENLVQGNWIGVDADGTRDVAVAHIAYSPAYASDGTIFVGTEAQGVFKTTDGGAHWSEVNNGLGDLAILVLAISPDYASDQTLFVGNTAGVYKTTDGGNNWAYAGPAEHGGRAGALALSPNYASDQTLLMGNGLGWDDDLGYRVGGVWISTDGGATWQNPAPAAGLALASDPGATAPPGIPPFPVGAISADAQPGLPTWETREPTQILQDEGHVDGYAVAFSPDFASDQTLFVGTRGSSRSLFKSTDGGATWTPVDTGLDASDIRHIALSPGYGTDQTLFVLDTDQGGALPFRSTNGGTTWTELAVGLPADYSQPLGFALSPGFATDGTIFASFGFGTWSVRGFFRSSDRGDTWVQANPGIPNQGSIGVVSVSPDYASDGELLLSARWNGLLGSTDAGDHWVYANGDLTDPGNGGTGVRIQDWAGENTIKGNLISNNGAEGILVQGPGTGANVITGNRIGTDASGTSSLGNAAAGVMIRGDSSENVVGAEDAPRGAACTGACNLVSGNGDDGIGIDNPGSDWNIIRGNFVGTDVTGSYALANLEEGISLWDGSADNWIQNNLVSGNGDNGIGLTDGPSSITITGNYVGLDASGTYSIPNGYCGVMLREGATDNTIGGDTPEERNVLSGNAVSGIAAWSGDAGHNTISGNYIGVDATGENPIGNGFRGIDLQSGYNVIGGSNGSPGGPCTGACNLVSGHTTNVMLLGTDAVDNTVTGNYIGVDVSGTKLVEGPTVPGEGLYLTWSAANNQIGGDTPEERNIIAGMIAMGPPSGPPVGNRIAGNYLGLDATGTACLGGSYHGISLIGTMNVIGGGTAAEGNRICGAEHHGISISNLGNRVARNEIYGHGEDGIRVSGGTAFTNTLTHNSIHDNGGLGINLVDGGNTELPAPVIQLYDLAAGTASGTAYANCSVELYSDNGGEGHWYEAGVTADGSGNWSIAKGSAFHGPELTATATDPAGNTSEFGQDWPADPPPPPTFGAPICGVTNRSRPTFAGFAQMGSLVRVGEGGLSLGEATTDDRNRWRVPAEESLADGAHVITATATTVWGTSTEAERDLTVDSALCYDPVGVTFTQRGAVQHPRDENGCADPTSPEPLALVVWPDEPVSVRVPVAVPTATVHVEVNSVRHDLADPDGDGVFTGSFTPPSSGALVVLLAADCGAGLDTMQIGSTIDPDGYVYDAQVLASTGITQTIPGITVTLQVSDTVRSRWVQWSADLYDQTNPQVTREDGYFAFFTPPGDFRLVADGVSQGYALYESPVLTVVDAPIRYNVGLWPAEIKRYVYLPVVQKGR